MSFVYNSFNYCTLVDLKNWINEDILKQLTDDNDSDDIDDEKINDAIQRACNDIDSYLRGRFGPLPIGTGPNPLILPVEIKDIATKISIWHLYGRSLTTTMPDPVKDHYKDSIRRLKEIQTGRYSPFEVQNNPTWFKTNCNTIPKSQIETGFWTKYLE